ncbi:MFS transporter [Mucilaginibacter pedocola]|uniref:MFS transporter permease n=1 Tax=Mucilaginibacter pedocola TaxID=1792845 RepID=A0A1S9PMG0_9SPHI|nr:MFS transporter [Mucilaginibacter pedocola]OOQ62135.1 MFS transporter permease [Mucilaginibacter pedocola]
MQIKNNEKTIHAWAMFDWANSAYNLVITTTIFPAYYVAITENKDTGDMVSFFGHNFINTALQNYSLSFAYLIMVILLPILSSIADYRGNKKVFMQFFTALGSLACCGLFFFEGPQHIERGIICFAIAAIGYSGGFVFYNSYLPEIATVNMQDTVSAKGFTYGYVGSVLLQLICFVFVLMPEKFGMTTGGASRLSFLLVGVWWIGFAMIPFKVLPKGSPNAKSHNQDIIRGGFIELGKVWKKVKGMPVLRRFLPAFFFYSMGVQTIMLVATEFGAKELNMTTTELITIILIIQVIAIVGATLMSRLSGKYGNAKVLILTVGIWVVVCIAAYFTTTVTEFYILAVIVGLVMGGIQSLSRSTYSKYLPQNIPDTASFFSFYDVTEKLSIVGGLFIFAFIEELTGSMRNSTLALCVFFVIGLVFLFLLLNTDKKVNKNSEFSPA